MTNEEVKELGNKFQRLLLMLGMGTSIILSKNPTEEDKQWWMKAIEAVVYRDEPIPDWPERKRCGKV